MMPLSLSLRSVDMFRSRIETFALCCAGKRQWTQRGTGGVGINYQSCMKINRSVLRYEPSIQCLVINYEVQVVRRKMATRWEYFLFRNKKKWKRRSQQNQISIGVHNVTHISWRVLFVATDNLQKISRKISCIVGLCVLCVCAISQEREYKSIC